jgi:uncharacterized protein YndB with AHSA1/START domain
MALGTLFLDGDHRGIRFERDFDAPPGEVWDAIATPDGIASWLARPVRWTLAEGAEWEVAFDDGRAHGTVRALEPGTMLELTWRTGDEPESLLRLELRSAGSGCRLVLEHTRLDQASATGYGAGWQAHLEALELALGNGGEHDWWARFEQLRPAYEQLAAAL